MAKPSGATGMKSSVFRRREFFRTIGAAAIVAHPGLDNLLKGCQVSPSKSSAAFQQPQVMESVPGVVTIVDGKPYLYFVGTSYYCLHGHPELIRAADEALHKYGLGSATARDGFGNNPVLLDVEKKVAAFFGTEDTAYFVSGYLGNMVLAQGLADRYDVIFLDGSSHYSVIDGAYSTHRPTFTFRHRDPLDLSQQLKNNLKPGQRPLVISDGIFPTFGRIAPASEYARLVASYNGVLCLDDAHAVGVLGPHGRGTYDHFGLSANNLYFCGTLSKAFGSTGGFITGTHDSIEKLRASVGVLEGSSPAPIPAAAAAAKGVEILMGHPEMRDRLRRNVARVKSGLRKMGLDVDDTPVPIVTWLMVKAEDMKRVQAELLRKGIAVRYSTYVGAPASGVLRASIFSEHTTAQIDRLLDELRKII